MHFFFFFKTCSIKTIDSLSLLHFTLQSYKPTRALGLLRLSVASRKSVGPFIGDLELFHGLKTLLQNQTCFIFSNRFCLLLETPRGRSVFSMFLLLYILKQRFLHDIVFFFFILVFRKFVPFSVWSLDAFKLLCTRCVHFDWAIGECLSRRKKQNKTKQRFSSWNNVNHSSKP